MAGTMTDQKPTLEYGKAERGFRFPAYLKPIVGALGGAVAAIVIMQLFSFFYPAGEFDPEIYEGELILALIALGAVCGACIAGVLWRSKRG